MIQTKNSENSVVIFEYFPLKERERATKLSIADLRRVVALTTGMLLSKLTFFHTSTTLELDLFNCVLFYRINPNSVSFSQSQCCRLRKILLKGSQASLMWFLRTFAPIVTAHPYCAQKFSLHHR